jgi:hypothetical protein
MEKYQKEIVKLTAKEVLLSVFDLALPFFETNSIYRASAREYAYSRQNGKANFLEKVRYLKKHGLVQTFVQNKEKYIEITPKGLDRINLLKTEIAIPRPLLWDGKWRVVIFDIPDNKKTARDVFRGKLIVLGFEKIQESVYAYPFECSLEISQLSLMCGISKGVLVMVSEIIQGEEEIIEKFLDKELLNLSDLQK